MKVVTARVKESAYRDLQYLMDAEQVDQAELIRKLLDKAIASEKIKLALEHLRENKITLRKASTLAGIPYGQMFDCAQKAGIDSGYGLEDLSNYLGK